MAGPAAESWLDFHKPTLIALFGSAALAIIILLIAWRPWQRGRSGERSAFAEGAALAGGYLAGQIALLGFPTLRPNEAHLWLFHAAVLSAVPWLHDSSRWPSRWFLRSILVLAALYLMLEPYRRYTWGSVAGFLWLAGLGAAWLGWSAGLEVALRRASPRTAPIALLATCACTAAWLFLSGFLLAAQLAGGLTAAACAVCAIAVWGGRRPLTGGGATVFGVLLPALWVVGYFFAEATVASVALLAAAPLLTLTTIWGPLKRMPPRLQGTLALTAGAICLAAALAIAYEPA